MRGVRDLAGGLVTPEQARQELHGRRTDAFTPYSLGDRVAAARIAAVIPNGPSRDLMLDIAAGIDTTPAHKEIKP